MRSTLLPNSRRATGISLRIVDLPWLNRVDATWLQQVVGDRRTVITLDNHYVQGGQGEMIAATLAGLGLSRAFTSRRSA